MYDQSVVQAAREYGALDVETMFIDASTGALTAVVGGVVAKAIRSATPVLSGSPGEIIIRDTRPLNYVVFEKYIDEPGRWVVQDMGRSVVMDASAAEKVFRYGMQGSFDTVQELIEQMMQDGLVEIIDEARYENH